MKDIIISFTLDNHKQAYLRRLDVYNNPITTTNIKNAKKFNKHDLKAIILSLKKEYKERITDIKPLTI